MVMPSQYPLIPLTLPKLHPTTHSMPRPPPLPIATVLLPCLIAALLFDYRLDLIIICFIISEHIRSSWEFLIDIIFNNICSPLLYGGAGHQTCTRKSYHVNVFCAAGPSRHFITVHTSCFHTGDGMYVPVPYADFRYWMRESDIAPINARTPQPHATHATHTLYLKNILPRYLMKESR